MQPDLTGDPERLRRAIAYDETYEEDVVNYVPGELCIVVSAGRRFGLKQLHDTIRTTLNRRLHDFLSQAVDLPEPVQVEDGLLRRALAEDLRFPLVLERFRK